LIGLSFHTRENDKVYGELTLTLKAPIDRKTALAVLSKMIGANTIAVQHRKWNPVGERVR